MWKGPWRLGDLKKVKPNGYKVFSCFSCGGGSTMGYKLAGYEVIGCCEIDKQMFEIYKANHKPKFAFNVAIQDILKTDLPQELYNLDILDGSPPCSSFSTAGIREKAWGKKKKFREGQAYQVLDDLFFYFINFANHLQPKIVIAENVRGLIIGKAKGYVKEIFKQFDLAGYETQLFLLNAATMGVPQARERTFFIARRKDLNLPKLKLYFDEKPIGAAEATKDCPQTRKPLTELGKKLWRLTPKGQSFSKSHPEGFWFNYKKLHPDHPSPTIPASAGHLTHWANPGKLNDAEIIRLQTFPDDFNFKKQKVNYVCGMSVPPYMTARIAHQISLILPKK